MEFRTKVDIPRLGFEIEPHEEMLFVGSCFAAEIGHRFQQEQFRAVVNPFGTMYNPVSVLHTLQQLSKVPPFVFLTLGTNHVYRLKETGEIVDNCQKRPAALFQEEVLTVSECVGYLRQAVELLRSRRPDVQIVFTVSPIRYRKYGYHGSQLSKATLLLAVEEVLNEELRMKNEEFAAALESRQLRMKNEEFAAALESRQFRVKNEEFSTEVPTLAAANSSFFILHSSLFYFPSYEILMDELRDYRFYKSDMLHPSGQAVDYIWERLVDSCFSARARQWLDDWRPVKQVLAHRPTDADSEEYRALMDKTMLKVEELRKKYPTFAFRKW